MTRRECSGTVRGRRRIRTPAVSPGRASVFFDPSAEAVVALVELKDSSRTLRDLEARYYRAVL